DPRRGAHHGALRGADELVVVEGAAVGVEGLPGTQRDRGQPALRVGQLHLVASAQRAAAHRGSGGFGRSVVLRGGHVGAVYVPSALSRRSLGASRRSARVGRRGRAPSMPSVRSAYPPCRWPTPPAW